MSLLSPLSFRNQLRGSIYVRIYATLMYYSHTLTHARSPEHVCVRIGFFSSLLLVFGSFFIISCSVSSSEAIRAIITYAFGYIRIEAEAYTHLRCVDTYGWCCCCTNRLVSCVCLCMGWIACALVHIQSAVWTVSRFLHRFSNNLQLNESRTTTVSQAIERKNSN